MDRLRTDEQTRGSAAAVVPAYQEQRLRQFSKCGAAQGQFLEQHAVRRFERHGGLSASAVHADPQRPVRLSQARRRQRSGNGLARFARSGQPAPRRDSSQWLGDEHQQLAVDGCRRGQPEGRQLPALHGPGRRKSARAARTASAGCKKRFHFADTARRRLRFLLDCVCAAHSIRVDGVRWPAARRSRAS